MKINKFYSAIFFAVIILLFSCKVDKQERLTEYVNPFIGTAAHGHTFPGATTPFGMVQLSPDNGTNGWDWCSGYNYSDTTIVGFSHKHLSGTGIGDLADILILPLNRRVQNQGNDSGTRFIYNYAANFNHDKEYAEPGYYSVELNNFKIKAELTCSKRVGFHRYTYNSSTQNSILIDLGFAINWDSPVETYIKIVNNNLITGFRKSKGWANNQHVYFAISLSEEIKDFILFDDTTAHSGVNEINGQYSRAYIEFSESLKNNLLLKVGLSPSNIEGALKNLNSEIPGWDFEKTKSTASDMWEKELQKIRIETSDLAKKETFYTSVYHSYIAPVLFSDVDGSWRGIDRKLHQKNDFTNYTVFSLWDTFRALHPLFTISQKDLVNDLIDAMLVHYKESGQLPIWTLEGCETNCMIGYHSVPVIVDAYKKGLGNFDPELALEAMKAGAYRDFRGLRAYAEYGYIPADLENESVSKALEYSYDDWCIAQLAKELGHNELYDEFMLRAQFYKNHFDQETGFMRGKNSDGEWKSGFNPLYSNHRDDEYTEGNAWQYSWFVPHDVQGLIDLFGGKDNFGAKLDTLFEQDTRVEGESASADISGLIGQYAHGNEPSHHVAYLYNYIGKPWKTQERVNEILLTLYNNTPDGICGNDDCGQMSAWYVLSSMGFYPVNAADGNFVIGRPLYDKVVIDIGDGKSFTITAENVSDKNMYIQSVRLNGEELNNSYISYNDIMKAGNIHFIMSDKPNKEWGVKKENYPPSMSRQ